MTLKAIFNLFLGFVFDYEQLEVYVHACKKVYRVRCKRSIKL